MRPSLVADPNDPRVALYRGARDPELLSAHGLFIAEGRLIVQRLLDRSAFRVRSVLCTPTAFGAMQDVFDSSQSEILLVDQDVMDAITTFNIHRGCLALAERGTGTPLDRLLTTDGPLVVLENVGNPDNVGGVFRNAAAFGASGVLLSPGCTDPLYRKAIRTSMGATLTTPFVADVPWPQALDALRAAEWSLIALTPAGDREIADAARQLPVDGRVALLCGHEGDGLSEAALARATLSARIAMVPEVDSLNVATAAAVALYALSEVRGQRSEVRGQRSEVRCRNAVNRFTLIVFDLDGTLVDSRRDLANSVNAMLSEVGCDPLPEARVAEMVGEGARVLVERALAARGLAASRTPEALSRFLALYDTRLLDHTVSYEGTREVLESLRRRGTLAVLTNKPAKASREILKGLDLLEFFADVIGGDSEYPRKPDPAALRALMARFGATPGETVMVGDSRIDLETARHAGVRACLVSYGFGFRFEPAELAGALVASSPADIARVLSEATKA